jgi:hypothetical protein
MSTRNGSEPANPSDLDFPYYIGLTKREYFAGLALQGILAADTAAEWEMSLAAGYAVRMADALLKALEDDK